VNYPATKKQFVHFWILSPNLPLKSLAAESTNGATQATTGITNALAKFLGKPLTKG
jgi:hypothetical protein